MTRSARIATAFALLLGTAVAFAPAAAGELRGSPASMRNQYGVAQQQDYDFLRTRAQIARMVDAGELVPVEGNADYVVDRQVPHRFARPEIRLFLERLGAQYRAATGRPLVVTSLVRPTAEQPRNAHKLSVHPVGMAVDLRVPASAKDRAWLEKTLLALENERVLDATREFRPPHYHVAVFPAEYAAHVARVAPVEQVVAQEPAPATLAADSAINVVLEAAMPNPAGIAVPLSGVIGALVLALGGTVGVRRTRDRRRKPRPAR